ATINVFRATNSIKTVGIRDGEKMHEVLVSPEELSRSEEFDEYYRVKSTCNRDYNNFFTRGIRGAKFARDGYTSENARRLSVPEIEELLLSLPEVCQELPEIIRHQVERKRAA
ncbi:MAG: polysaccharide biosynthesis protein, partial [Planctomycetales bacterium]|nr:polysaccharide biosynthesis protein [Planctomycetales bacterium]